MEYLRGLLEDIEGDERAWVRDPNRHQRML